MSKNSKSKLVFEEIDAEEYADEDSYYEYVKETRVKENKPEKEVVEKPKEAKLQTQKTKPVPMIVQKSVELTVKEEVIEEKEPILETVDDWEAAMDALDAHVSALEEQKAKVTNKK